MAAKFKFRTLTNDPNRLNVISTKLGARQGTAGEQRAGLGEYSDTERFKAVKIGTEENFVLCADGDELDGFIDNIDSGGTTEGFTFGGVARGNAGLRIEAQVATGAAKLSINDLVVAAAQLAVGTPGLPQVKGGAPERHLYRVMSIVSGTGVAGDRVIIEKL